MKRAIGVVVAAAVLAAGAAAAVAASGGVSNGGFESGVLAPWTAINHGSGQWSIDDGTRGPTCAGFAGLAGPRTGAFDALYDQTFPTSAVLYQDVTVPANAPNLTFAAIWINTLGFWAIAPGSEFGIGAANQWISVDVLKAGSNPQTFDSSKILATPLRISSGTSDLDSGGWKTFSADLTAWAGQTVRLRVAGSDSGDCLPFAVDDFAFTAAPSDDRIAYCSVAGNTWPDGTAIVPGTFLNLQAGQPESETEYAGAVPANYVAGKGLTCDPPPAGYTLQGKATAAQQVAEGVYPYYAPSS